MSAITPRLYLGGVQDARSVDFIQKAKITYIIWLSDDHQTAIQSHLKFKNFRISDYPDENIIPVAKQIYEIIISNPSDTFLVHCTQGVSRSPSVIIYFVMTFRKVNYDIALEYVKGRRSCTFPNDGFEEQLLAYEVLLGVKPSEDKPRGLINPYLAQHYSI